MNCRPGDLLGSKAVSRVALGARWQIPSVFCADIDLPALGASLVVEVRTRAGRAPEITEAQLRWHDLTKGPGLTPTTWRAVRLGEALDLALQAARGVREDLGGGLFRLPGSPPGMFYGGATAAPRRGVPIDDAHLRRIAEMYRDLVTAGSRAPTQDIAEALNYSRSTVGRWLVEARRRGLLGPAVGTRAGVAPKPRRRGSR